MFDECHATMFPHTDPDEYDEDRCNLIMEYGFDIGPRELHKQNPKRNMQLLYDWKPFT
jgi:hypothetical protein